MKLLILALAFSATQAFAAEPKIHFTKPADNETVTSPFLVEFKVEGMTVEKAGVVKKGTGHHHLIVDGKSIPVGKLVPKDKTHLHYGDGQVSTTLELPPGKHTLTLQFADWSHISLGPEYSNTITVNVK